VDRVAVGGLRRTGCSGDAVHSRLTAGTQTRKYKIKIQIQSSWLHSGRILLCFFYSRKDKQLLSSTIDYKRAKYISLGQGLRQVIEITCSKAVICNSISVRKPRTSWVNTFYTTGYLPVHLWLFKTRRREPWFRLWFSLSLWLVHRLRQKSLGNTMFQSACGRPVKFPPYSSHTILVVLLKLLQ